MNRQQQRTNPNTPDPGKPKGPDNLDPTRPTVPDEAKPEIEGPQHVVNQDDLRAQEQSKGMGGKGGDDKPIPTNAAGESLNPNEEPKAHVEWNREAAEKDETRPLEERTSAETANMTAVDPAAPETKAGQTRFGLHLPETEKERHATNAALYPDQKDLSEGKTPSKAEFDRAALDSNLI